MEDIDIMKKLTEIIKEQLGVRKEEVKPECNFKKHLGTDSFDELELVMACEEIFGVEISDDLAERIKTVNDLYRTVKSLVEKK